ncbi:MAG: hypothetical protein JXC32_01000 [Anaerolineae bacterium]|nr:hypothetical protein [Anaerolineae bacterium]
MAAERFWRWFELEMVRRGFRSVRQVERAGEVGNDTISGRQRHGTPPTDTVIRAIAQAFQLPFEAVQRVAEEPAGETNGEAPDPSQGSPQMPESLTLRELWGIVSKMPIEDQRAVLDYALFRRSRNDERQAQRRRRGPAASRQTPAATDGD